MSRILAVDDSPSMRQMVAFTLRSAGFDVAEAEDGVIALDLARKQKFSLAIVDINMPNMDGMALIRALRAEPDYKFTPLLMLTTEAAIERKQEGKAAGATGWIVKPFNPEQLVATVKRVLG
jgi:two-component system chemotaxis response regulator CheY